MSAIGNPLTAWRKACELLDEANALDASRTPGVVVHAAYYAMHHAARACLMRASGHAPVRHDKVTQAFGFLAKNADDDALKRLGHDLNAVQERRLLADYEASRPTPDAAITARDAARQFLALCAERFGFPAP